MSGSPDEIALILNRMRVPGEDGLFIFGSFERPATLYMQQVRALNLIYALRCAGTKEDCSLAVIGAGAGGLTAASAAAMLGWRVTLLDRIENNVLSLAGSVTHQRWLHPHIYDWPAEGKECANAGLCVLNWSAGPADRVIADLRTAWRRVETHYGIETYLGATEISIDKVDRKQLLQWNGARSKNSTSSSSTWGARPFKRFCVQLFDLIILAVGFGKEEPTENFPMVYSYWTPDEINQNRAGKNRPDTVLISGNGDGGLIDILRFSFSDFRHDTVLDKLKNEWLGEQTLQEVSKRLCEIEAQAYSDMAEGKQYEAQLNVSYRMLTDSLNLRTPIPLRDDVIPILTGKSRLPLTLESAPLNRFLFSISNTQYLQGPLTRAKKVNGCYNVWFEGQSELRNYDELVIRHGPTSALEKWFPEIHKKCAAIAKVARETRDPSREPKYDRFFEDLLSRASQSLETQRELLSPSDVRNTISLGHLQAAITISNERYRKALSQKLQWLDEKEEVTLQAAFVMPEIAPLATMDELIRGRADPMRPHPLKNVTGWVDSGPPLHLIIGAAGAGKTTLLRYLAWQAAQDASRFPLFVPLRSTHLDGEGPLLVRALDWCLRWLETTDVEDIGNLRSLYFRRLLQGRAIVILDGFDELSLGMQATTIDLIREGATANFGGNTIVLSSRKMDPFSSIEGSSLYQIMPFSQQQMHELVARLMPNPEVAGAVVSMLASVVDAGLAPQSIGWLRLVAQVSSEQPPQRGSALGILGEVLEIGLRRIPGETVIVRSALSQVAYQIYSSSEAFSRGELTEILKQSLPAARVEELAEAILSSPIIVTESEGPRTYSFLHRSITEYLVSLEVVTKPHPLQAIARMAFDPRFFHSAPPAMAIGSLPEPDTAFAFLETLPDSVDHALLRLRLNAMRFTHRVGHPHIEKLALEIELLIRCKEGTSGDTLRALADILVGANQTMVETLGIRLDPLLREPDNVCRCRALLFVGAARLPNSVARIAPALVSEDENVREAAAEALGELGDPAGTPFLVQAYLHNPGAQVFRSAVTAVRMIGGPLASEALISLLSNRALYRNLRWPVAEQLGRLGNPAAINALIASLSDPADVVRQHAVEALGLLSADEALEGLLLCLSDAEAGVRIEAAKALGRLRNQMSAPHLLRAMKDSHPVVREEAARALAGIDQQALLEALQQAVADLDSEWRGAAAALLAEIVGPEALPLLRLISRDPNKEAREGAARGLGLIPHDDAKGVLTQLLEDEGEGIRYQALRSLARQNYLPALPKIIQCLRGDESSIVRAEAADALRQLGDAAAVEPLISVVEADPITAPFAALSLGGLKDEAAIPALAAAWRRQQHDFFRSSFLLAIGRIDGPIAAAVLRDLFMNDDDQRRFEVVEAFYQMKHQDRVPGILAAAADSARSVKRLAQTFLRSLAYRELATGIPLALSDAKSDVRAQAARLAPFYADKDIETALRSLRETDPDEKVRKEAVKALEALDRKKVCFESSVE